MMLYRSTRPGAGWAQAIRYAVGTYTFTWSAATTASTCTDTITTAWPATTTNAWRVYPLLRQAQIVNQWHLPAAPRIEPGADQVAEALLRRHLTPRQLDQLQAHGYFDVEKPGRTYRINRGRYINIQVLEGERIRERLCFYPGAPMPHADTMLAQKLMLEANEQEALRIAIRHAA